MTVLLRNVIDGVTGSPEARSTVDLLVSADASPRVVDDGSDVHGADIIDGAGVLALPGFTDLYARLREPGPSRRGTLASEARAALIAGFTRACCAPDTDPAIDSTATVELVLRHAAAASAARVLPIAALTTGLHGTHLAELATLKAAGCVAVGQADTALADTRLLYDAMHYATSFELPLLMTPRDAVLGADGCAHDGAVAARLGLPAIPVAAESIALARLLELVRETGARLHVSRLSSARAVEMIGNAKRAGLPVSADVGIAHLWFTEDDLDGFDARYASAVPFRSTADRAALRAALVDGTLDAICSDHAPLDDDASLAPFPQVERGLSIYDRFVPMLLGLVGEDGLTLTRLIEAVTKGASGVLGLPATSDVVLIDPTAAIDTDRWVSAGRNSPWLDAGDQLGAVRAVVMDGRQVSPGAADDAQVRVLEADRQLQPVPEHAIEPGMRQP